MGYGGLGNMSRDSLWLGSQFTNSYRSGLSSKLGPLGGQSFTKRRQVQSNNKQQIREVTRGNKNSSFDSHDHEVALLRGQTANRHFEVSPTSIPYEQTLLKNRSLGSLKQGLSPRGNLKPVVLFGFRIKGNPKRVLTQNGHSRL